MPISKNLKDLIGAGFPDDIENPIYSKNGSSRMKFDEIRLSNMYDVPGGIKIEFFYRGKATHWTRVCGSRFSEDTVLHIKGIEGEQGFELA